MKCDVCGGDLRSTLLPEISGRSQAIVVTLSGFTCLACADHPEVRRLVDRDVVEELCDKLFFGHVLPCSRQKGMVRKTQHCASCGGTLDLATTMTGHVGGPVETRDAGTFSLNLDAPTMACPVCGVVQLVFDDDAMDGIAKAIADAFSRVGLAA